MSLHGASTRTKTGQDVRDADYKALALKRVNKGLVGIRTPEVRFEASETPAPPMLGGKVGCAPALRRLREAVRGPNSSAGRALHS